MAKVGQILRWEEGDTKSYSIRFGNPRDKEGNIVVKNPVQFPITINEGDRLFLNRPADDIQGLVELGYITQEQADTRIAALPSFLEFNVVQSNKKG